MENNSKKNKKSIILNTLIIIVAAGFIIWGGKTYFDLGNDLYTNDAQIEEYINPVNTRISGYIKEVRFNEHQQVKKGDTLVIIDNSEYKIQLEQTEAAYLSSMASKNVTASSVNTVESGLNVTDANIKAARARLWNAEQNYHRYENLLKEGAATQQQFDQVKTDYDALVAQTNALQDQRVTTGLSTRETSRKMTVNDADIKRAHASLDMAQLNLSYTIITAPYDGYTGRRIIQEGQLVQAGQTLLSFIRNDNKWVVANYKETQIGKLHIGQKVSLTMDGFESQKFVGVVSAISQATGSRFSAIPTDNSTGNFIKVQQRIPVKIDFTNENSTADYVKLLRAGMNVEVRDIN
ncbi:HlyD family secretion protein [Mucilaginibacter sp.]|uniref:HlyD family secretion protein n=1 Tax=Mucilaginibacter sp. TaxID=1882438 RepID=UPI00261D272A|nr:HlyD family secretion protein [Mucilaginibacter sp.]MDB4926748.1 secretion protein HlyD family protein [Mucilaginibacter sp.]